MKDFFACAFCIFNKYNIFFNLVDGYKNNKGARRHRGNCYRKQRSWIPRRKFMKRKQELEKTIVEPERKYKDILFGNDTPICKECLNELKKQQIIDERSRNQKLVENTIRKLTWNSIRKNMAVGDIRQQANSWVLKLIILIIKISSTSISWSLWTIKSRAAGWRCFMI